MENKTQARKKQKFVRYKSVNQVKLKGGWRRVRGMHNKVRLKKKGHVPKVSIGYGNKKGTRNLYNSQIKYKLIVNLKDLENLSEKYILISRSIGLKKKIEILKKAKELNLNVIRIKDIDTFLKKVQDKSKEDKMLKEKRKQEKEIYQKKAEEKSKEKKAEPVKEETSDNEEKRRVLESKK